ncbi:MAG: class F sortase [bacterium]|nr:class F sortase [bacterium]
MRSDILKQKKIRILQIILAALVAGDFLLWHNVFTYNTLLPIIGKRVEGTIVRINIRPDVLLPVTQERSSAIPLRIEIPSIAINAPIEQVTVMADGSMGTPKRPFNTAWYALGPRPGETGSAVIAGHVDWVNGATAVFENLHKVKPGDKIIIQDDKGTPIFFVVRKSKMYTATANAVDVFSSSDGGAHLNIITCYGTWDKSTKQYSERLVVFADLVDNSF